LEHAITHSSGLANRNDVYCRFASSLEYSCSTLLTVSISCRASQGILICCYSFMSKSITAFSHSTASIIRPSALFESSRRVLRLPFFLFLLWAGGSRKSKLHTQRFTYYSVMRVMAMAITVQRGQRPNRHVCRGLWGRRGGGSLFSLYTSTLINRRVSQDK
jgi:hypothetical protein